MVYYSVDKRWGEPVVCLFGAKRLHDGTVQVDILAVAEKWQRDEVMVESPDGKSRMRIRLPADMVGQPTPIMGKNVRVEQV